MGRMQKAPPAQNFPPVISRPFNHGQIEVRATDCCWHIALWKGVCVPLLHLCVCAADWYSKQLQLGTLAQTETPWGLGLAVAIENKQNAICRGSLCARRSKSGRFIHTGRSVIKSYKDNKNSPPECRALKRSEIITTSRAADWIKPHAVLIYSN